jgi:serine/threonine protein kinase
VTEPLPDRIGDWTVLDRLGSGGAANVFHCRRGEREVAIKLLRTGLGDRGDRAVEPSQLHRRLTREAEILMRLDHPNIVRVRSVELQADPAWIVMDFVAGRHAGFSIKAGPAPVDLVRRMAHQLLSAMAHWHAAGIAHRDIKPGNLIIDPRGHVVVVDFGLALDASQERLSAFGVRVGTWAYAPPEWVSQDGGDPNSWDLYGAGQVLYELLLGRRSFDPKAGLLAIMQQKEQNPAFDPGPQVPADLRELVCRLTARDPAARPCSAEDALLGVRR